MEPTNGTSTIRDPIPRLQVFRMTSLSDDLVTSISGSGGGNGKLSKFICFGQHTNPNVIVKPSRWKWRLYNEG